MKQRAVEKLCETIPPFYYDTVYKILLFLTAGNIRLYYANHKTTGEKIAWSKVFYHNRTYSVVISSLPQNPINIPSVIRSPEFVQDDILTLFLLKNA